MIPFLVLRAISVLNSGGCRVCSRNNGSNYAKRLLIFLVPNASSSSIHHKFYILISIVNVLGSAIFITLFNTHTRFFNSHFAKGFSWLAAVAAAKNIASTCSVNKSQILLELFYLASFVSAQHYQ